MARDGELDKGRLQPMVIRIRRPVPPDEEHHQRAEGEKTPRRQASYTRPEITGRRRREGLHRERSYTHPFFRNAGLPKRETVSRQVKKLPGLGPDPYGKESFRIQPGEFELIILNSRDEKSRRF